MSGNGGRVVRKPGTVGRFAIARRGGEASAANRQDWRASAAPTSGIGFEGTPAKPAKDGGASPTNRGKTPTAKTLNRYVETMERKPHWPPGAHWYVCPKCRSCIRLCPRQGRRLVAIGCYRGRHLFIANKT